MTVYPDIQVDLPVAGNSQLLQSLPSSRNRAVVKVVNAAQMAFAEAYINGFVIPDSVLKGFFNTFMPILFQRFPSLLAPYYSENTQ